MVLYNLCDRMEYFETVVDWLYDEWGLKASNNNRIFWESWVRSSLSKNDIPQTYIALEDEELIATFSLWRCDLQSRQDIFPWFGGLVVAKDFRRMGYGCVMQREALQILYNMGYNEVHLFTEIKGYYEKTGWDFQGYIPDETGKFVRLYKRATQ